MLTMLIVVVVLIAALGLRLYLARRASGSGDFVNPWTTWQRPDRFGPPAERHHTSSSPGPPPGHLRGDAPRSPKDW
jgi:hypothetical protein